MSSKRSDRQSFIEGLAQRDRFPWETISCCLTQPDDCIPIFLLLLERQARGLPISSTEEKACFFATHVLAAHRVNETLSPLSEILLKSRTKASLIFGDAIGDSIPRVLMGIGAGESGLAWESVCTPGANWMVREAFLRLWTFEALNGRVDEADAITKLRNFPNKVSPEPDNPLWGGWMTAIADLGLRDLKPLVESFFETGHIARDEFGYLPIDRAAFEEDLQEGVDMRGQDSATQASWARMKGYRPFMASEDDFRSAARHVFPEGRIGPNRRRYPAPLLRVAEPDKDFTP